MSVTLTTAPPTFAFSADQIVAKFASSNYFQSTGAFSVNVLTLLQNVPAGTEVQIKYGSNLVNLKAALAPDESGNQFLADTADALTILPFLESNYLLSRDFELTAQGNAITLTSFSKKLGYNIVPVASSAFTLQNTVMAATEAMLPNYAIYFKLYLENITNDGFKVVYETKLPLIAASNTTIAPIGDKLHTEITKELRSEFPDIPEQEPLLCKKSCRRYYFEFSESYGDVEQVQKLQKSAVYTVLHGGLSYVAQFNKTLQGLISPGLPAADRFLKQGSNVIYTRTNQPQYLYFFNTRSAAAGASFKVKFFFTDETSAIKTIVLLDLETLRKYGFNIRYDQLVNAADYPGKTVTKYEVWLENSAAEKISENRTYVLNYQYREFVRYFLSWSSFGSLDTRLCYGKGNSEFELFQKEASKILQLGYDVKQGNAIAYDLKIKSSFKVATGWLSKRDLLLNRDFYLSAFKYRYVGGLMLPIRVDSKTIPEIEDGKNLFSQLFDYSYQFDDHAYTEGDEEDPGVSSGDFFFNYGPVSNPTQGFSETDPTVPSWVKGIKSADIDRWNNTKDYADLNIPTWVKSITIQDIEKWNTAVDSDALIKNQSEYQADAEFNISKGTIQDELHIPTDVNGSVRKIWVGNANSTGYIPSPTITDLNFVYDHPFSSTLWEITHDLNKYPSVSVVDTAGTVLQAEVVYHSMTYITIEFNALTAGKAYLN